MATWERYIFYPEPDTFDLIINCHSQRDAKKIKAWMKWKTYFKEIIVKEERIELRNKIITERIVNYYVLEEENSNNTDPIPLVLKSIIVKYLASPAIVYWLRDKQTVPPLQRKSSLRWRICVDLDLMMI